MNQHGIINRASLAGTAILLSTGSALLAGEPAPYIPPPAPPADCSGCVDPGFYVEGSLLYMNSYRSSGGNGYEGDWDLGYRGAIGFENASGLFVQLTGFYYNGDYDSDDNPDGNFGGEVDYYTLDLLIGDTVHCGELCLSVAGGLRYGGFETDLERSGLATIESHEFDGWGPVIEIAAERTLTEQFSLYAELRQSLLFGEVESSGIQQPNRTSDTLAAVTEIGAGLQFNFAAGPVQNAFVRLGFEGQYWHVDGTDSGLLGGVLSIGGTF